MKSETEQFPEWVRIPTQMQYQFFDLAEKQAEYIKSNLLKDKEKLSKIDTLLRFEKIPENDEWKNWRIAVVDGSDSPVMSERVGGRFGTYGATYHIFQGVDLIEEEYFSGHFYDFQIGDPEVSKKLLSLLTTKLEREIALYCLRKDVDLLFIDGSFFGFRPRCRIVHNHELPNMFENGATLVKHVRDISIKLLESGKALGIVKRVQTSAIDGWMIYENGNDSLRLNRNDKEILSSLIREGEWFSYETAFGNPVLFNYYTRLALAYRRYRAADPHRSIESIFDAAKGEVDRNVRRDLLCEPGEIFKTARHYIRCSYPVPPFCFETPVSFNLEPVLAFFNASCNKATGLPLPFDLTDQDITMPSGFTREFVEEIEARLVKDRDLDKYEVENHFASLNPQKQE